MNVNTVLKSGKVFGRKCTQQSESRRLYVLIRPRFKHFDNMSNFYLDKVKHCAAETAETLFVKFLQQSLERSEFYVQMSPAVCMRNVIWVLVRTFQ